MARLKTPLSIAIASTLLAGLLLLAPAGRASTFAGGTLQIRIAGAPPVVLAANPGTVSSGDSALATIVESSLAFGPANIDLPDSLFTGIPQPSDLRMPDLAKPATGNVGSFFPGGLGTTFNRVGGPFADAFGGQAPLAGDATICFFNCLFIPIEIPLTIVGVGGTFTGSIIPMQPFTATAADGWTTQAAQVTGIATPLLTGGNGPCAPITCPVTTLLAGIRLPTLVYTVTTTGSNNRTAGGAGTVTLVTPVRILSSLGHMPRFAKQTLIFVPEPTAPVLLAAGAGIFGLYGVIRTRGSRRLRDDGLEPQRIPSPRTREP